MNKLVFIILVSIVMISGCINENLPVQDDQIADNQGLEEIDCDLYTEQVKADIELLDRSCTSDADCIVYDFHAEFGCRRCFNKDADIGEIVSKIDSFYAEARCPVRSIACAPVDCGCVDNVCAAVHWLK